MVRGNTRELNPRTSPTLAIFDPTTLPTAIVVDPSSEAARLTTNSGNDVPNATTVKPITMVDNPKYFAN
jgi:hypothetical protein